jgi:hypothetical protein
MRKNSRRGPSRTFRRQQRRTPSTEEHFDETLLGPASFLPKKVVAAIFRIVPRCYWRRMSYFYQDYGCLRCCRRDQPYGGSGLCANCAWRVRYRVKKSLEKREITDEVTTKPVPEERMYTFRRRKARQLLAGFASKKRPLQRARGLMKSNSWRTERVKMPFGVVEFIA